MQSLFDVVGFIRALAFCAAFVCGLSSASLAAGIILEDASKAPQTLEPGVPFVAMMNCAPRAVSLYVAVRGDDDTSVEMPPYSPRRFSVRVPVSEASRVEFTARFEGDAPQRVAILKPGTYYRIIEKSRNGNYVIEPLSMPAMGCQQR